MPTRAHPTGRPVIRFGRLSTAYGIPPKTNTNRNYRACRHGRIIYALQKYGMLLRIHRNQFCAPAFLERVQLHALVEARSGDGV